MDPFDDLLNDAKVQHGWSAGTAEPAPLTAEPTTPTPAMRCPPPSAAPPAPSTDAAPRATPQPPRPSTQAGGQAAAPMRVVPRDEYEATMRAVVVGTLPRPRPLHTP
jgi:hypothetical protein